MPTFPFSFEFEFQNDLGREHLALCEGTYAYDGKSEPEVVTLTVSGAFSEWDDATAYEAAWEYADEHVADICDDEFDPDMLPTASEASVPPVGASA